MPSSESFNWLHLTDLHYGLSGQRPLWPNVRQAFFEDLKKLHDRCGPWHAILFTGDLVQAGKAEEFKALETDVLGRLWVELRKLGSGDAVLLAVPGNHDLVRPDSKKPTSAARWLLHPEGFSKIQEIQEEFWDEPEGDYRQVVTTAFSNYGAWWGTTGFRPDPAVSLQEGLLPGDFAATLQVGPRQIGIVGLNTTFLQLAGGDYQGRLAWDLRQLEAVCVKDMADWFEAHDLCLLLTHQGPEWLDKHSAKEVYQEINPAGRFAVHLFGHMHETVVRSTSVGGGKPLRQWQDCSLFGMEKFGEPPRTDRRHGYGAGLVEFGTRETVLRFWPRRAIRDGNGWRFIPHDESCVLEDDEGTAPEPIAPKTRARSIRRRAATPPVLDSRVQAEATLLAAYAKAARVLWDIIDLAGLPEGDRQIAMQRLLRQLYIPLRMEIERSMDEGDVAGFEERRDRQRLAATGRGSAENDSESSERMALGDWLRATLDGAGDAKEKRSAVPRLVLLGDPGGGKTTLLRWLATAYLLRRENDPDLERLPDAGSLPAADWLPILIRCRDLDLDRARRGQGDLEDLLWQTVAMMELPGKHREPIVNLLRTRIEEGRALLLVDGLDEITDPRLRAAFCGRLETVAERFEHAPILATSRIVGYRQMHRRFRSGFAHATLAELSPAEKDDFIRRWCEVTIPDPARREVEAEKLQRGIQGSDRIQRLTTNPMLLTTMALVQRKVGKLPTRRHKLYWEAVGVLLNWHPEVEEVMDPDETLPQLEYIAYAMCDLGVQRLRRDEVLTLLEEMRRRYPPIRAIHRQEPEIFLAQVERRTGILAEVGEVQHYGKAVPVYEFRHLTFQEYLAALAILEGRFPGHQTGTTLAERVKPLAGRIAEIKVNLRTELQVTESWREILRLCVASCNDDDLDPVLRAILEPQLPQEARPRAVLAVLCLTDEPNVSEAMANTILQRFAAEVKEEGLESGLAIQVYLAALEASPSVWTERLRNARVETRLADRHSEREREVLHILLDNQREYLRRQDIYERLDPARRPTPGRVGQILGELYQDGLLQRIHGRAQGDPNASFYTLSPRGVNVCRALRIPGSPGEVSTSTGSKAKELMANALVIVFDPKRSPEEQSMARNVLANSGIPADQILQVFEDLPAGMAEPSAHKALEESLIQREKIKDALKVAKVSSR